MKARTVGTLPAAPSGVIRTCGDTFDRKTGVFFPAISTSNLVQVRSLREANVPLTRFLLPYNDMPGSRGESWWENSEGVAPTIDLLTPFVDDGLKVFLDSGVYSFCHAFGRMNGVAGHEVFSYPSSAFGDVLTSYTRHYGEYVRGVKHLLWGAVELDIGTTRERIARRRAMLRDFGVGLVPVFRPESDPISYLETIMRENDRICMPVTVKMLPSELRWRLVAKAVELQRTKYPYCYIHVLGTAPVPMWVNIAAVAGSCDSSTWTNPGRFGNRPTYSYLHGVQLRGQVQDEDADYVLSSVHGHERACASSLQSSCLASMSTFLTLNACT